MHRMITRVLVAVIASGAMFQAGFVVAGDAGPVVQVAGVNGEMPGASVISLKGNWRFALDPKSEGLGGAWHKRTLADHLELPGSCEQRGFGMKPDRVETDRLTHALKYVGPAWYQRDIEIPEKWAGKRVELFLERCCWETTVWVDDIKVGTQNSLCTPHVHDLGSLGSGKHTLTICVDNTVRLPIGSWCAAISEDTQGNWNGIIGRLELRATDPVWIRNVQVFASRLRVHVGNRTGRLVEGELQSHKVSIPANGGEIEVPFAPGNRRWDEFNPGMQRLKVVLEAGAYHDVKTYSYAVRAIAATNGQFSVNGRPVLMRGPVDECIHPLTGYPPMDKGGWLRVLKIAKSYGFNFMRFHSWCPPDMAFEAADELGMMFQVELPFWSMDVPPFGAHGPRDQFLRDEMLRILETYGNHPSFALMAMGNESGGSLDELVKAGRARDNRHLFRCENGRDAAHGDYVEDGLRGIYGPRTDWDRLMVGGWIATGGMTSGGVASSEQNKSLTILSHEVGQWEIYANLDDQQKYTGTLRAPFYEQYRKSLEAHHMLDQAQAFREASGKLSVLLYKDEIEGCERTWPFGGFQILEARDMPSQGISLVGFLDAFWNSKGLITPEEFRQFCGPVVCLARLPTRVYTTADTLKVRAEVSQYGPSDLAAKPKWSLANAHGRVLAKGKWPALKLPVGSVTPLEEISIPLKDIAAPARLVLTIRTGEAVNSWNLWVYPAQQEAPPANVIVARHFDKATRDALASGQRVLLFSSPREGVIPPNYRSFMSPQSTSPLPVAQPGRNALEGSFTPTFWNLKLFGQIGTMGILCDPKHPALAGFPTEQHSDWQWADLLGNFSAAASFHAAFAGPEVYEKVRRISGDVSGRSKAIILDETPADYRPIVQVIDNYKRNSKLGVIFETRVGAGKLLVCAMDLDTDRDKRPAARQLQASLLAYAAGDRFAPRHELPLPLLERLLTVGRNGE